MKAFGPMTNLKHIWVLENIASQPYRMGCACYAIVFIGAILHSLGFDKSFERSGSVLIILVLYFIYLNHFVSVESRKAKEFLDATSHLNKKESVISQFKRQSPNISNEQANYFANSIMNTRKHSAKALPSLQTLQSNLITTEFIAGAMGTAIWGFGDLV